MPPYNQLVAGAGQAPVYGSDNIFGLSTGNAQRNQLSSNMGNMSQFGGQLGNAYMGNQAGINNTIGMLQGQAQGQNSVSAMQMQQGLNQSLANQQSMAASASPNNAAMAARNAAMNMNQLNTGTMGQQAVAGLQERQQALGQLSQLQLGQSGQNLNGMLGAYNGATQAGATYLGNQPPSLLSKLGGLGNGLASGLGAIM